MTTVATDRFTPQEYLALERAAEIRSEYLDGRIVAMTGGTERHASIVLNIAGELRAKFRGGPCRVYANDLRVRIERGNRYVYPDVVAVCGERRFADGVLDTLLNPALIVEVLSDSTEAYDRGEKFAGYRALESLREYVLVAQSRVGVERYRREGDAWVYTALDDLSQTLELASVDGSIALADIYEGVDFGA